MSSSVYFIPPSAREFKILWANFIREHGSPIGWAYEGSQGSEHSFAHGGCGFLISTGKCEHGISEQDRYATVTWQPPVIMASWR
jgi:hypothetical protein